MTLDSRLIKHRLQLDQNAALAAYESARSEIIQRIQLRDQSIRLFLVVVAGILAFLSADEGPIFEVATKHRYELAIVPLFAIGVFQLIKHHNMSIAYLGRFCAQEVPKRIGDFPQWDGSEAMADMGTSTIKDFSLAYQFTIFAPSVLFAAPLGFNTAACKIGHGPCQASDLTIDGAYVAIILITLGFLQYEIRSLQARRSAVTNEITAQSD